MKKTKFLVFSLFLISLNSCAQKTSSVLSTSKEKESSITLNETSFSSNNTSSSNSSISESIESSSVQEEIITIEEIDNLAKVTSSVKKLNWTDSRDLSSGTVLFSEKEIIEQGKKDGEDFLKYRGYDNKYYYEINQGINSVSKKYRISSNSSSFEKTQDEAIKLVNSFEHTQQWFYNKAKETYTNSSIISEKTTIIKESTRTGFRAIIKAITNSTRTYETIYEFNENKQLIFGSFKSYNWDQANINFETHEVIDPSQKPKEKIDITISLTLGAKTSNENGLKFDLSPYFITTLKDVYVSTFNDEENNKNICEVGKYIDLYLDNNFLPETALDKDSFTIISSSNENVIAKASETSRYYQALNEGTSTLIIGNYFQEITKEIVVEVRKPSLTSLYIECPKLNLFEDDETSITLSSLPSGADRNCEIIIDDSSIISVNKDQEKDKYIVKALKPGIANVYFKSLTNPNIKSNTLSFIIKEKLTLDISSLYGTWTWTDNSDFNCTLILNDDKTGSLSQKVTFIAYPNKAEFNWEYDGTTIVFSNWYSEEQTIRKPTKVLLNEDFSTLSITASSMDADEIMRTLNMQFKKVQS